MSRKRRNKGIQLPAGPSPKNNPIEEAVQEALKKVPLFPDNEEGVLEEALSVSTKSPKTGDDNLHRNFDHLWDDVRATFHLLDKVGVTIAKGGEIEIKIKALLVAAGLELRHHVKEVQKDLGKFRKDVEVDIKEIKKNQEELKKTLVDFKKMVDLYLNPPEAMGPISRKTLQAFKGVGKE